MKKSKLLAIFIAGCVVTSPIAVQKAQAGEMIQNTITFTKETGNPFVDQNNRTMVPLRVVVETLGCDVEWNQQNQTATIEKDDNIIEVPIGKREIEVNGKTVVNDTVATVIDGRTYLPIRAVVEGLGGKVDWNQTNNQVIITYQGQTYIIPIPKQINQNEVNQLIAKIEQNIKDANYYRNQWPKWNDDVINTWINEYENYIKLKIEVCELMISGEGMVPNDDRIGTFEVGKKRAIEYCYAKDAWMALDLEKKGKPSNCSTEKITRELEIIKNSGKNPEQLNAKLIESERILFDCIQYGKLFNCLNSELISIPVNHETHNQKINSLVYKNDLI